MSSFLGQQFYRSTLYIQIPIMSAKFISQEEFLGKRENKIKKHKEMKWKAFGKKMNQKKEDWLILTACQPVRIILYQEVRKLHTSYVWIYIVCVV